MLLVECYLESDGGRTGGKPSSHPSKNSHGENKKDTQLTSDLTVTRGARRPKSHSQLGFQVSALQMINNCCLLCHIQSRNATQHHQIHP